MQQAKAPATLAVIKNLVVKLSELCTTLNQYLSIAYSPALLVQACNTKKLLRYMLLLEDIGVKVKEGKELDDVLHNCKAFGKLCIPGFTEAYLKNMTLPRLRAYLKHAYEHLPAYLSYDKCLISGYKLTGFTNDWLTYAQTQTSVLPLNALRANATLLQELEALGHIAVYNFYHISAASCLDMYNLKINAYLSACTTKYLSAYRTDMRLQSFFVVLADMYGASGIEMPVYKAIAGYNAYTYHMALMCTLMYGYTAERRMSDSLHHAAYISFSSLGVLLYTLGIVQLHSGLLNNVTPHDIQGNRVCFTTFYEVALQKSIGSVSGYAYLLSDAGAAYYRRKTYPYENELLKCLLQHSLAIKINGSEFGPCVYVPCEFMEPVIRVLQAEDYDDVNVEQTLWNFLYEAYCKIGIAVLEFIVENGIANMYGIPDFLQKIPVYLSEKPGYGSVNSLLLLLYYIRNLDIRYYSFDALLTNIFNPYLFAVLAIDYKFAKALVNKVLNVFLQLFASESLQTSPGRYFRARVEAYNEGKQTIINYTLQELLHFAFINQVYPYTYQIPQGDLVIFDTSQGMRLLTLIPKQNQQKSIMFEGQQLFYSYMVTNCSLQQSPVIALHYLLKICNKTSVCTDYLFEALAKQVKEEATKEYAAYMKGRGFVQTFEGKNYFFQCTLTNYLYNATFALFDEAVCYQVIAELKKTDADNDKQRYQTEIKECVVYEYFLCDVRFPACNLLVARQNKIEFDKCLNAVVCFYLQAVLRMIRRFEEVCAEYAAQGRRYAVVNLLSMLVYMDLSCGQKYKFAIKAVKCLLEQHASEVTDIVASDQQLMHLYKYAYSVLQELEVAAARRVFIILQQKQYAYVSTQLDAYISDFNAYEQKLLANNHGCETPDKQYYTTLELILGYAVKACVPKMLVIMADSYSLSLTKYPHVSKHFKELQTRMAGVPPSLPNSVPKSLSYASYFYYKRQSNLRVNANAFCFAKYEQRDTKFAQQFKTALVFYGVVLKLLMLSLFEEFCNEDFYEISTQERFAKAGLYVFYCLDFFISPEFAFYKQYAELLSKYRITASFKTGIKQPFAESKQCVLRQFLYFLGSSTPDEFAWLFVQSGLSAKYNELGAANQELLEQNYAFLYVLFGGNYAANTCPPNAALLGILTAYTNMFLSADQSVNYIYIPSFISFEEMNPYVSGKQIKKQQPSAQFRTAAVVTYASNQPYAFYPYYYAEYTNYSVTAQQAYYYRNQGVYQVYGYANYGAQVLPQAMQVYGYSQFAPQSVSAGFPQVSYQNPAPYFYQLYSIVGSNLPQEAQLIAPQAGNYQAQAAVRFAQPETQPPVVFYAPMAFQAPQIFQAPQSGQLPAQYQQPQYQYNQFYQLFAPAAHAGYVYEFPMLENAAEQLPAVSAFDYPIYAIRYNPYGHFYANNVLVQPSYIPPEQTLVQLLKAFSYPQNYLKAVGLFPLDAHKLYCLCNGIALNTLLVPFKPVQAEVAWYTTLLNRFPALQAKLSESIVNLDAPMLHGHSVRIRYDPPHEIKEIRLTASSLAFLTAAGLSLGDLDNILNNRPFECAIRVFTFTDAARLPRCHRGTVGATVRLSCGCAVTTGEILARNPAATDQNALAEFSKFLRRYHVCPVCGREAIMLKDQQQRQRIHDAVQAADLAIYAPESAQALALIVDSQQHATLQPAGAYGFFSQFIDYWV